MWMVSSSTKCRGAVAKLLPCLKYKVWMILGMTLGMSQHVSAWPQVRHDPMSSAFPFWCFLFTWVQPESCANLIDECEAARGTPAPSRFNHLAELAAAPELADGVAQQEIQSIAKVRACEVQKKCDMGHVSRCYDSLTSSWWSWCSLCSLMDMLTRFCKFTLKGVKAYLHWVCFKRSAQNAEQRKIFASQQTLGRMLCSSHSN